VLLLFGTALIALLSTLGFVYIIPAEIKSPSLQWSVRGFLCLGVFNICARYLFAVGTNPGTPSSRVYERALNARIVKEEDDLSGPSGPPSLLTWSRCKKTGSAKPPRAHYDSVNRELVMNFDHWCPWLFNSVGYGNYRHFLVFLGWIWVLTSLGLFLSAEPFFTGLKSRGGLDVHELSSVSFVIVFCLCLALSLAIGVLFSWHLFLSMTAQTSVDFLILHGRRSRIDEDYPNPFDSGSIWSNLSGVLFSQGGGWWELLFPPHPARDPAGKPFPGAW